jgi:hypothetical protein
MRPNRKAVNGVIAPGPRLTLWALYYFVVYVALPIVGLGLALDALFYFALREAGRCYGVLCLFT